MKTVCLRVPRLGRIGVSILVATCLGAAATGIPVNAAAHIAPEGRIHPQAAPCGVKVYMTASGSTGQDVTNDGSVKTSLELNTNLCITVGVEYFNLSTVSGTLTTSNYDVIYLQGQNNWGSSDRNNFGTSDVAVIENFLAAGGGMVVGEWQAWNACASSLAGAWGVLDSLMPVSIRGNCAYGSNQKVRFYRWERPLSPLIDTGVGADFVFEPADFAGSLSFLDLKTGATPYYWATWDSVTANIPAAVDPANLPAAGGVGMAGWVPVGKPGRVFAFSTTNGAPELADTSASNSFRRLLINALGWSGSIGGSINPDTVKVTVSGGTVNTPPLTPSRITGNVTYSIVSGTLPTGVTLNTSTGAITGTSTQNGTFTVTIQGIGSTSGSAQAVVSLQVSGVTIATTTTTTTVASAPTTAPPSTTAGAARVSTGSNLPSAGSAILMMTWLSFAMLFLGGLLFAGYRRRM